MTGTLIRHITDPEGFGISVETVFGHPGTYTLTGPSYVRTVHTSESGEYVCNGLAFTTLDDVVGSMFWQ